MEKRDVYSTIAHELFGHGYSFFKGYTDLLVKTNEGNPEFWSIRMDQEHFGLDQENRMLLRLGRKLTPALTNKDLNYKMNLNSFKEIDKLKAEAKKKYK